ncbi:hypothetical protein MKX41_30590 [Paenibacillus sp. FSL R5-0475]|uniref:hypothetical protein n=1 Tax=Paenibacillus sp. FSL R5-0475 TaxID=2921643 RepID=UPI0030FB49E5
MCGSLKDDVVIKNTDAFGSIAGYHIQVYKAVELVTTLTHNGDSVGLECGADIGCFFEDGTKKSWEVKFYKREFSENHEEIIKTIYNFYLNNADSEKLSFTTNSSINKAGFYKDWSLEKKIEYIKNCLLRYCVSNIEKYKKNFEKYMEVHNLNKKKALKEILKVMNNEDKVIENYLFINEDIDISQFAKKIEFIFENKDQLDSYENLKLKAVISLRNFIKTQTDYQIEESVLLPITHKLADEFYETCVRNNSIDRRTLKEIDYQDYKKITIEKLKAIIGNYEKYVDKYSTDIVMKKLLDELEELKIEELIADYNEERILFIEYSSKQKKYDPMFVKEWVEEKKIKFTDNIELQSFLERFFWYCEGLDFIGYIITKDITTIDVHECKLFITSNNGQVLPMENNNLYDIQKIKVFIEKNKKESNTGIELAIIKNKSFSNLLHSKNPFIQIERSNRSGISLCEYINKSIGFRDDMEDSDENDELETILKKIILDKGNSLIIGDVSTNKTLLLNALLHEIDNSQSIIHLYENEVFKPSDDKNINNFLISDIETSEKENRIKELKPVISNFNYKFFNLDNYHCISNSVLDTVLSFYEHKKGCYAALKYSVPGKNQINSFLETLSLMYSMHNKILEFKYVEYLIIINSVKNTKSDSYIDIIDSIYHNISCGESWSKIFQFKYPWDSKM